MEYIAISLARRLFGGPWPRGYLRTRRVTSRRRSVGRSLKTHAVATRTGGDAADLAPGRAARRSHGEPDPVHIAGPLIALLPGPRDRVSPILKAVFAQAAPTKNSAVVTTMFTLVIYRVFMLLAQWMAGGLEAPGGRSSSATSTSAIESPSTPTSSKKPQRKIE
jgi:hypothetical protein